MTRESGRDREKEEPVGLRLGREAIGKRAVLFESF